MGCDIHMYSETMSVSYLRNSKINESLDLPEDKMVPEWVCADKISKNKYYNANEPDGEREFEIDYNDLIYSGRNYYLFSILADVRSWTGSPKPISKPRGIPRDCSTFVKGIIESWGGDGHSHSYFTLEELLNVNWDLYDKSEISGFLKTIEKLKSINPDPSLVRIVFFFDN